MSAQLRWSSHDDFGRTVSCPGELVNLTCTVNSGGHIWSINSESMPDILQEITIDGLISNARPYPLTRSVYTFDGYKINRSLIVTYVTIIATNGTINVTCKGFGTNVTQSAQVEFAG